MESIAYDERGLVPCVIQDAGSGEVLTLAYMNAEALDKTRETGELHLWSRSRLSTRPAPPATPASAPASSRATIS